MQANVLVIIQPFLFLSIEMGIFQKTIQSSISPQRQVGRQKLELYVPTQVQAYLQT